MTPTQKQLDRELQLGNLIYALHRGWHDDPRWREALDRVTREQEAEVADELHPREREERKDR